MVDGRRMEPEMHESDREGAAGDNRPTPAGISSPFNKPPDPPRDFTSLMQRVFLGPQGLRAGWSAAVFLIIFILAAMAAGSILTSLRLMSRQRAFTPRAILLSELVLLIGLLAAIAAMAVIEQRRVTDYNLADARRARHFFSGIAVGIAALSALVGEIAAGGWMHLGTSGISAAAGLRYALFWGCVFLLVGWVEEGTFRCYLQFTFTRGINFWWALGVVALACADLAARHKGHGAWGDYAIAALGIVPCLWLHLRRAPRSSFWQAAWATSTLFGFVHTANGGENWVGIFSAAAIGFVFCVSVYLTGSAWWAIGCHAGWDWAETYFYGTADSGLAPTGHLFASTPIGNPLWSGGADGPEGSLLILGILVLLLLWLLAVYGRRSRTPARQSLS